MFDIIPVKPSDPGLLFFGRFLITVSILVFVIELFMISIQSWFSLGRLNFSKNLSISSRLSILLAYSCSQYSLMILCVSGLSVVTSFSFLILLIWVFLFFLMSLANGQSMCFIFSRNRLLVLLIFGIVYISFSFISVLISMISFILLILGGLILLFLDAIGVRLGCLFYVSHVSCFLRQACIAIILFLSSQHCFYCIP